MENHLLVDHKTQSSVALAPARGGMVTRFRVGATNVLYMDTETLHDPAENVRGGIPVLFPIAGRLRDDQYRVGDKVYTLRQHGFARTLPWTIVDQSTTGGARMALELTATPTTRAQYPFEFRLLFTYVLEGGRLTIVQRYTNTGDVEMPIQPGLHPYFYLPDAQKGAARVLAEATTVFDNRTGKTETLRGPLDLTADELDLHLLDHWPREVHIVRPCDRDLDLALGVHDRILVIWTLRGSDFLCVEPWSAPANALNEEKALRVPPNGSHETTFSISVA